MGGLQIYLKVNKREIPLGIYFDDAEDAKKDDMFPKEIYTITAKAGKLFAEFKSATEPRVYGTRMRKEK